MAVTATEQKEIDRVNEEEYQKTLKTNPNAKRGEKAAPVEEVTTAGAVEVKIEPAKSTIQGEAPKEHPEPEEAKKEVPTVSSVAQLRDAAAASGETVTTEQVAEARAAEDKAAEEGGKLHRPPAAERGEK